MRVCVCVNGRGGASQRPPNVPGRRARQSRPVASHGAPDERHGLPVARDAAYEIDGSRQAHRERCPAVRSDGGRPVGVDRRRGRRGNLRGALGRRMDGYASVRPDVRPVVERGGAHRRPAVLPADRIRRGRRGGHRRRGRHRVGGSTAAVGVHDDAVPQFGGVHDALAGLPSVHDGGSGEAGEKGDRIYRGRSTGLRAIDVAAAATGGTEVPYTAPTNEKQKTKKKNECFLYFFLRILLLRSVPATATVTANTGWPI